MRVGWGRRSLSVVSCGGATAAGLKRRQGRAFLLSHHIIKGLAASYRKKFLSFSVGSLEFKLGFDEKFTSCIACHSDTGLTQGICLPLRVVLIT